MTLICPIFLPSCPTVKVLIITHLSYSVLSPTPITAFLLPDLLSWNTNWTWAFLKVLWCTQLATDAGLILVENSRLWQPDLLRVSHRSLSDLSILLPHWASCHLVNKPYFPTSTFSSCFPSSRNALWEPSTTYFSPLSLQAPFYASFPPPFLIFEYM